MISETQKAKARPVFARYIPHIEVILPVFNERENIPLLLNRLDEVAFKIGQEARLTYLFVNDGSTDGTTELLQQIHDDRSDIRIVNLLHNFGHNAALAAGLDHFEADAALVMDADLQDPPEALVEMFQSWKRGAKTVVAERASRKERNSIFFKTFYFLLHKVSKNHPPINFGTHSLLDHTVIERLRTLKERNRYFPGLVGFSSHEIARVSVDRQGRAHGKSRVGFWGLVQLAVTAFLSFSSTPVRLVSIVGLMASLAATIGGAAIVWIKLFTDKAIPGWASTMSLIFFSTGMQLLCMGVIGEYIARIYEEVKQRPLYLVGSLVEKSQEN
jgi:glycosyltransferase involved in cell wall biosynthesis